MERQEKINKRKGQVLERKKEMLTHKGKICCDRMKIHGIAVQTRKGKNQPAGPRHIIYFHTLH